MAESLLRRKKNSTAKENKKRSEQSQNYNKLEATIEEIDCRESLNGSDTGEQGPIQVNLVDSNTEEKK